MKVGLAALLAISLLVSPALAQARFPDQGAADAAAASPRANIPRGPMRGGKVTNANGVTIRTWVENVHPKGLTITISVTNNRPSPMYRTRFACIVRASNGAEVPFHFSHFSNKNYIMPGETGTLSRTFRDAAPLPWSSGRCFTQ